MCIDSSETSQLFAIFFCLQDIAGLKHSPIKGRHKNLRWCGMGAVPRPLILVRSCYFLQVKWCLTTSLIKYQDLHTWSFRSHSHHSGLTLVGIVLCLYFSKMARVDFNCLMVSSSRGTVVRRPTLSNFARFFANRESMVDDLGRPTFKGRVLNGREMK